MHNEFYKPPSYCCQKCGECLGYIGRFLFPFLHKCLMKDKKLPSSLVCKVFGHKWQEWVTTEHKMEYREVLDNGFGITSLKLCPIKYGYMKDLSFCKRCWNPNPNYSKTTKV